MLSLITPTVLWWLSGLSVVTVVLMFLGLPWVVGRLPVDYFSREHRTPWRLSGREPLLAIVLGVLKNILGLFLVVVGIVLLFTPGQGILTLLLGLALMNFPGKYQLERWLVQRPGVLSSLNWMRQRGGNPPFDPGP